MESVQLTNKEGKVVGNIHKSIIWHVKRMNYSEVRRFLKKLGCSGCVQDAIIRISHGKG